MLVVRALLNKPPAVSFGYDGLRIDTKVSAGNREHLLLAVGPSHSTARKLILAVVLDETDMLDPMFMIWGDEFR